MQGACRQEQIYAKCSEEPCRWSREQTTPLWPHTHYAVSHGTSQVPRVVDGLYTFMDKRAKLARAHANRPSESQVGVGSYIWRRKTSHSYSG